MPLNNPKKGPGSVDEFLVSSIPYVSCSSLEARKVLEIQFPNVTRSITIRNTSSGSILSIAFSQGAFANNHYFDLRGDESFSEEFRIKDLFLSHSKDPDGTVTGSINYSLIAGLTLIEREQFPILTGSSGGIYSGIG